MKADESAATASTGRTSGSGAHAAVSPQPSTPGPQAPPAISDHELLRRIGHGSYGEVWLARTVLGELRAVKIVHRSSFDDDRPFQREFEGLQKFAPISRSHPSQIAILHVGRNEAEDYFYYVMELADAAEPPVGTRSTASDSPGEITDGVESVPTDALDYVPRTLRSELKHRAPLPPAECVTLGLALAEALTHLHQRGLVHRDIKPSNIIFVGGVPKLADIGLVTDVDASRSFVGTEGYLPPEGPGTPQADIYGLGKVLYELCTGKDRKDYPALPPDLRERSESEQHELLELNAVLVKACATDPLDRYQSAAELHADLALLQRGDSVKHRHRVEKRVLLVRRILTPMLLVAVLAGGGWYWLTSLARRNSDQRQSAVDPARRAEAQKLYEQAKMHPRNTRDGITKATELLNQAILADPDFARAYAYLAQVYLESAGWHLPPKLALTEAKKNAVRSRLLDASLAQAHLSLAQILFQLDQDSSGAETEFKRTIELSPTNAWSYVWYGGMLSALGRFDDADAVLKHAQELEPTSQVVLTGIGWRYYQERRFPDALVPALKVRAMYPNEPVSHQLYACVQERLKNYPEALAAAQRARQLDSAPDLIALVGFVQARSGQRAEAEKTLHELNAIAETRYVSPIDQAWLYAGLGEVDKVVERLQKAHEEVPLHPALLQTEPKWDEVRADPRFITLLQKMRLEK